MTKLFSISVLFVILGWSVSQAQDSPYYEDAVQLAARLSADKPTGDISEHLIYSIEDALLAVAQSPSVAANAVAHKYSIHTAALANTSNVRIIVGKEAAWLQDLTLTPIHKILPIYVLNIKQIEETDAYVVLDVSSEKALNMKFIGNEISVIEEIWMVELPSVIKEGNDIKLRQAEEGFIITYCFKAGNCTTGCEEKHYWEFSVTPSGEVSFIGEHGTDLAKTDSDEQSFFTLLGSQ